MLILAVGHGFKALPQKEFEIVIKSDSMEVGFCTFETSQATYITLGSINKNEQTPEGKGVPIVIQYSDTSDVIVETFPKEDTSYYFQQGFQKSNGNYIFIGPLKAVDWNGLQNVIYSCELTPDLELVWEKAYPMPEGYTCILSDYVIDLYNNIVVSIVMKLPSSSADYIYLIKFDMEGNMINCNFDLDYETHQYNDMVVKPDSMGYYIFGYIKKNGGLARDWLDIDNNLNIVGSGGPMGGENYVGQPVTSKWLPNGNLFIVNNESQETPGAYRDMEVRVSDPEFNTVSSTVYFDEDKVYNPVYKGMDYIYDDLIWTCTFNDKFPHYTGNEIFKVYLFDSEMNLKGMKVFGGNSRWWFFHLLATTDGGSIITGITREDNATTLFEMDIYIKKLMPEDILTSAEETKIENDMDVAVFPNPFTDCLIAETARNNLSFTIYDIRGQEIFWSPISNIPKTSFNTGGLMPGFYFYTIIEKGHTIQSGKLLKQ